MCRAVAEALVTQTHLVVQAGTGTGKSLAYLVPAALSGKKVVVATATKALQDQLADKDLPLVESGLGLDVPLDVAVLKGRSNYVCRQRVSEVGAGGVQAELGDQAGGRADEAETAEVVAGGEGAEAPPEGLVEEVRRLVAWSQTADTGDRGDLAFEPSDRAWNMLSVGPRECPGAFNCPQGGRCFAEAARDRAAAADIVVVNTHLYGAHLASGGAVLPEHEVVVFDEAHELEEVMTASLGVEVTPGRFRSLVTAARPLVELRDAALLESSGNRRRPAGCAARRADRDARAPGRRTWAGSGLGRRPRAGRDRGAGRRAEPAGHRRVAAKRGAAQLPGRGRGGRTRPGEPQDPHAAGGRPPLRGPAPPRDAARRRGGLGRRDAAQRAAAPLPHRRRAGALVDALGRGDVGADQRDHPAAHRRARRPRGLRDRGAQRRQSLRLPRPRAALRGPAPARPARPGRGGGAARGAGPAARGGGRAHARPLHQPAGHRGGRRGARPRAPLRGAAAGRPAQGAPARGVRRATRPRASSPPSASGRASTFPAARSRWSPSIASPSRVPTTRSCRRGATGRAGAPSRWWTCHGRPPCWRRGRDGSSATRRTGASSPCSTPDWPPRRYRGVLLATLPPMRRSVDRGEVESFLRRALDGLTCETGGSVAEAVEHLGAVLPVLLDLHVEVEVGALGQRLAHGDADLP